MWQRNNEIWNEEEEMMNNDLSIIQNEVEMDDAGDIVWPEEDGGEDGSGYSDHLTAWQWYELQIEKQMRDLLVSMSGKKRLEWAQTWEEFMCISLMQCLQVRVEERVWCVLKTSSVITDSELQIRAE